MKEAAAIAIAMLVLAVAGTAGGENAQLPCDFPGVPSVITQF